MHVAIRKSSRNGLREDSFVKCEQIMTIDKGRLIGKPWGALDAAEMAAVDAALRRSIGLN
jgi:mRNA-degrading endonuclease toxin of MazEF toxin-antitoxin module